MGQGSSSTIGKASLDVDWKYKLYFDSDAGDADCTRHDDITDDELLAKIYDLVDDLDPILETIAYKVPLWEGQLTSFLFYHMFIVFRTKNWWWSIEKHSDGISIQRSKKQSAVLYYYRRKKRNNGVTEIKRRTTPVVRYQSAVLHNNRPKKSNNVFAEIKRRILIGCIFVFQLPWRLLTTSIAVRDDNVDQDDEPRGKNIFDIVWWLYKNEELKNEYRLLSSNCKHFAASVYDECHSGDDDV